LQKTLKEERDRFERGERTHRVHGPASEGIDKDRLFGDRGGDGLRQEKTEPSGKRKKALGKNENRDREQTTTKKEG